MNVLLTNFAPKVKKGTRQCRANLVNGQATNALIVDCLPSLPYTVLRVNMVYLGYAVWVLSHSDFSVGSLTH